MLRVSSWVLWAILGVSMATGQAFAQGGRESSAYEVVRQATAQVLEVVQQAGAYIEQDPDRYFDALRAILDPVIDYRGFARGVMGDYATSERYRSLDSAGREQLRAQLDRFTVNIRLTLIRTYGKGLLAFGGSRIEVGVPPEGEEEARVVSVEQQIFNDGATPYLVNYQMGRNREGQWKLRNVIIESVNLGQIYRSQFQSAARKYDGDIDAVVDSWSVPQTQQE